MLLLPCIHLYEWEWDEVFAVIKPQMVSLKWTKHGYDESIFGCLVSYFVINP